MNYSTGADAAQNNEELFGGSKILGVWHRPNSSGGTVQRLPALPARYFPVTAGHRWAQSALRLLSEVKR